VAIGQWLAAVKEPGCIRDHVADTEHERGKSNCVVIPVKTRIMSVNETTLDTTQATQIYI